MLRKQKDCTCAMVLKALALIRLHREPEAQIILNEVEKEEPVDDATLQAMTMCFRELNAGQFPVCLNRLNNHCDNLVGKIAETYELALRKEPQNEELLSHLFMAYVRMSDYQKQQQTALKLYKIKPKNPYYFWSVMSLYLQVCTTSSLE